MVTVQSAFCTNYTYIVTSSYSNDYASWLPKYDTPRFRLHKNLGDYTNDIGLPPKPLKQVYDVDYAFFVIYDVGFYGDIAKTILLDRKILHLRDLNHVVQVGTSVAVPVPQYAKLSLVVVSAVSDLSLVSPVVELALVPLEYGGNLSIGGIFGKDLTGGTLTYGW